MLAPPPGAAAQPEGDLSKVLTLRPDPVLLISGTTGRIAKFTGPSDLGDSAMFESAGNIGLGTTGPGAKFDVRETGINVVAAKLAGLGTPPDYNRNVALSLHPRVDFVVNDGARIEAQLTGGTPGLEYADLALQTRAAGSLSTKMLIQSGGNVGIGTTAPGTKLDVRETGINVVAAKLAGLGTPPDYNLNVALSLHPRVDFVVNDGARIEAQLTFGASGSESADLALQTRAAGSLSTKMLIQSGGNVGIGAPAPVPTQRLEVAGNVKVTGTGNGIIFPDGTLQTTACAPVGFSVPPAPRLLALAPAGWSNSNKSEIRGLSTREIGLAVEDSPVTASLIAAIKEQQRQISELRAEVEALRSRLNLAATNGTR